MTDDELQAKTALFNQTLMTYGQQKALHVRVGSTAYESSLLELLSSLLKEIQIEIEARRTNETQSQAATVD